MQKYFPGETLVQEINNEEIYLNHDVFNTNPRTGGVDLLITTELISNFLLQESGVSNVFSKAMLRQGDFNEGGYKGMAIRGYNIKRSGDIVFILEPGWIEFGKAQGTDHGSQYSYDTHIPMIFFGKGIKKGSSVMYHSITDIAPTLSALLKIKFPNGCTGQPIGELFER
jgi:hypothetical protein